MSKFFGYRFRSLLVSISAFAAIGASPASAQADVDRDTLRETAAGAIEMLERDGISATMPMLEEPPFFDRESGLHVWAMDGDAIVVLDASGQTSPGNDLSTLSFDGETLISEEVGDAATTGEVIVWHDLVPHAVTEVLMTSQLWCVESSDIDGHDDVILCAMAWFDEE